jgi:hypothetical protein
MEVHRRANGGSVASGFFERGSDQHRAASLAPGVWGEGRRRRPEAPNVQPEPQFVALALTTPTSLRHKRDPAHLPGSNFVSTVETRPWGARAHS